MIHFFFKLFSYAHISSLSISQFTILNLFLFAIFLNLTLIMFLSFVSSSSILLSLSNV
nr:MAG TPA: hypothetical protein [Caudoviricetes sp.]